MKDSALGAVCEGRKGEAAELGWLRASAEPQSHGLRAAAVIQLVCMVCRSEVALIFSTQMEALSKNGL